mmetsp:Transcript_3526/g.4000  ORF Transcript_3526/g.4000 Transcript_3526/m.4000 type:complete len:126 (-) Transcript_3526:495-872(-)
MQTYNSHNDSGKQNCNYDGDIRPPVPSIITPQQDTIIKGDPSKCKNNTDYKRTNKEPDTNFLELCVGPSKFDDEVIVESKRNICEARNCGKLYEESLHSTGIIVANPALDIIVRVRRSGSKCISK